MLKGQFKSLKVGKFESYKVSRLVSADLAACREDSY
jgi:hypothetical protein